MKSSHALTIVEGHWRCRLEGHQNLAHLPPEPDWMCTNLRTPIASVVPSEEQQIFFLSASHAQLKPQIHEKLLQITLVESTNSFTVEFFVCKERKNVPLNEIFT